MNNCNEEVCFRCIVRQFLLHSCCIELGFLKFISNQVGHACRECRPIYKGLATPFYVARPQVKQLCSKWRKIIAQLLEDLAPWRYKTLFYGEKVPGCIFRQEDIYRYIFERLFLLKQGSTIVYFANYWRFQYSL